MSKKGLLMVFTGDGKGKTTASLGIALRALLHGMKVLMIQFIKGSWKSAETKLPGIFPGFEIVTLGKGFVLPDNMEESKEVAREAWERAKAEILKGEKDLYILDELNYAVGMGFISQEEVVEFLEKRPERSHIIITGRGRFSQIEKIADLVTEMRKIKHPFDKGVKAIKGIDF